jgi:hypothetical protein
MHLTTLNHVLVLRTRREKTSIKWHKATQLRLHKPLIYLCLCVLIYAGLWKEKRLITRWSQVQVLFAPTFLKRLYTRCLDNSSTPPKIKVHQGN